MRMVYKGTVGFVFLVLVFGQACCSGGRAFSDGLVPVHERDEMRGATGVAPIGNALLAQLRQAREARNPGRHRVEPVIAQPAASGVGVGADESLVDEGLAALHAEKAVQRLAIIARVRELMEATFSDAAFNVAAEMSQSCELVLYAALDAVNMVLCCYPDPACMPPEVEHSFQPLYRCIENVFSRDDIICNRDGKLHETHLAMRRNYAKWNKIEFYEPTIVRVVPSGDHDELLASLTGQLDILSAELNGWASSGEAMAEAEIDRIQREVEDINQQLDDLRANPLSWSERIQVSGARD